MLGTGCRTSAGHRFLRGLMRAAEKMRGRIAHGNGAGQCSCDVRCLECVVCVLRVPGFCYNLHNCMHFVVGCTLAFLYAHVFLYVGWWWCALRKDASQSLPNSSGCCHTSHFCHHASHVCSHALRTCSGTSHVANHASHVCSHVSLMRNHGSHNSCHE